MSSSTSGLYPLANPTRSDLANICEALWGWLPCPRWIQDEECQEIHSGCSCGRAERLGPFFDFYRNVTAYYLPDVVGNSHPALRTHKDLRDIVSLLTKRPDTLRSQLTAQYFEARYPEKGQMPPASDQKRAFNLAARVVTMVPSAAENQPDGLLEAGMQPIVWRHDKSLSDFVASVFPKREQGNRPPGNDLGRAAACLHSIKAKRLRKVAKLQIVPTDDLSRHLYLDEENGTVYVFHYTCLLKEVMATCMASEVHEGTPTAVSSPRVASIIPPELAVETLSTIKDILFPDDGSSQSMLRIFVFKQGFDPDMARIFDLAAHVSRNIEEIQYCYWGPRLLDLCDELENPTPRGFFEKYFEQKSGARHIMMATLAGVAIAVILGIFGLSVSIFQAWVGWQQWQHPLEASSNH